MCCEFIIYLIDNNSSFTPALWYHCLFKRRCCLVQTSLIRTPKGQNQVSALQRCPYYRGRECMVFGISGTKQTVRNREVSVRRG